MIDELTMNWQVTLSYPSIFLVSTCRSQFLYKIWRPDTFFLNGRDSYLHKIAVPNRSGSKVGMKEYRKQNRNLLQVYPDNCHGGDLLLPETDSGGPLQHGPPKVPSRLSGGFLQRTKWFLECQVRFIERSIGFLKCPVWFLNHSLED